MKHIFCLVICEFVTYHVANGFWNNLFKSSLINVAHNISPFKKEMRYCFGKSWKTWTGSLMEEPSSTQRSWSVEVLFHTSRLRGE